MFDADLVFLRNPRDFFMRHEEDIVLEALEAAFLPGLYSYPVILNQDNSHSYLVMNNGVMCVRASSRVQKFYEAFTTEWLHSCLDDKGFAQTAFGRVMHRDGLEVQFDASTKSLVGQTETGLSLRTLESGSVLYLTHGLEVPQNHSYAHAVYGNTDKKGASEWKTSLFKKTNLWFAS